MIPIIKDKTRIYFLISINNSNNSKTQSKIELHFKIHQNHCFGKNNIKHPKMTKCHQNLDILGNITYNKCRNVFLEICCKDEVTCRNKGIPRNWHILVSSTVRTLIFHILPPETCFLNISTKVPKICKIILYFEVTS